MTGAITPFHVALLGVTLVASRLFLSAWRVGRMSGVPTAWTMSDLRGYALAPHVTNYSEGQLFGALCRHMPSHLHVIVKPRLEDIIGVRGGLGPHRRQSLRGRVRSRHLDFVIIDRAGRPLAGIELDGPSHGSRAAQAADRFKNALCDAVGLPLYRVRTDTDYARAASKIVRHLGSQDAKSGCRD